MDHDALIEQIRQMPDGVKLTLDLGWANGWPVYPLPIMERCKELGHKTTDTNRDPTHHGLHHEVRCRECGYVYHYDSSG